MRLRITVQWLALLVLSGSSAGYELVHRSVLRSLGAADIWWHLRTGIDILATHSLPHTGWGSQLESAPWIATSWLYDVLLASGYRVFDLRVLVLAALIFRVALAALVFVLAGGLRGRFWMAAVLSAITQYLLGGLQPLPVYVSVLAFGAEMFLLLEYRRTKNLRVLYWLPPLFLFWANFDVQFVYGVLLLLLFVAVSLVEQRSERVPPTTMQSQPHVVAIVAGSLVASIVTPYGWTPYSVFFAEVTSTANQYLPDHLALRFRTPQDYVLLLLAMTAFLALGLRRSRDLFQLGVLIASILAAFHAQRDLWLVVLASAAFIPNPDPAADLALRIRRWQPVCAAVVSMVVLALALGVFLPHDRKALLGEIGQAYPVAAADYVRSQHLPQPLFNSLRWGGFLAWYLPEYPVAIDGRTNLYGDNYNTHYAKVMNADEHYSTFTPLDGAATLVLEKNSLMSAALASVPAFRTVYSDEVAVVLVKDTVHQ